MDPKKFRAEEKRAIAGLSTVLGFRMLGLSMLIPVFSVYAVGLPGSTTLLAGLAFSVYGLTQALLQIPFGYLSDRFGRRPIVVGGLALFGIGSIVAALTTNIYILIAARFVQGAGAIASACFAWIADLTEPARRNMAMAFMGISIGGGIVIGMIIGPIVGGIAGVPFLFWLAAALSFIAIAITVFALKEPQNQNGPTGEHEEFSLSPTKIFQYAMEADLIRLDIVGMLVNMSMIGVFFVAPLRLAEEFAMSELWKVYLPLAVLGGAAMGYSSRVADKGGAKKVTTAALFTISLSFVTLAFFPTIVGTLIGFALFFMGFSVLEATLPAAVSKLADQTHKGAIIGVFNFSVFMGTFFGGLLAGFMAGKMETLFFCILTVAGLTAAALIYSSDSLDSVGATETA